MKLALGGAAGQSFGAWAGEGVSLVLEGTANDYVGKGLSGGHLVVRPAPEMVAGAALASAGPASFALAGNTCLYGATGGRLHVVGRAGMRFAIRNSGAEAVVEGLGPHGCEYMTGGTVVVLGPVGQSFGAGMTGGRAYLWDPSGRHVAALHARVRPGRPARRGRGDPGRRPCADRRPGPAPRRAPGRRLGARDAAARVGQRGVRRRLARGARARRTRGGRDAGERRSRGDADGLVGRRPDPQPNRNRAVA